MTDPITPPPELVQEWIGEFFGCKVSGELTDSEYFIATRAAQWGADQELEACCEVLARELICDGKHVATDLRMIRRPKPPSLKEQALTALTRYTTGETILTNDSVDTIRRALEALPDD